MVSVFRKHKALLLAFLLIVVAYAMLFALGMTCPIKLVLGISCPGCGMSRAYLSALRLDFAAAFSYHPLWFLLFPFVALLSVLYLKKKFRALRGCLGGVVAFSLIVYAYRMLDFTDAVVVFEPQNGLIVRSVRAVFFHHKKAEYVAYSAFCCAINSSIPWHGRCLFGSALPALLWRGRPVPRAGNAGRRS